MGVGMREELWAGSTLWRRELGFSSQSWDSASLKERADPGVGTLVGSDVPLISPCPGPALSPPSDPGDQEAARWGAHDAGQQHAGGQAHLQPGEAALHHRQRHPVAGPAVRAQGVSVLGGAQIVWQAGWQGLGGTRTSWSGAPKGFPWSSYRSIAAGGPQLKPQRLGSALFIGRPWWMAHLSKPHLHSSAKGGF